MSLASDSVITGDCNKVLRELPEESVHAVVTDPPYALGDSGFMNMDWDNFSDSKTYQKWCEAWAVECLRVLKPGGHLLAFGGNTRHHRLFSGVEDAGFEVRDTVTWHYGSGFPKALDVGKAIQKANGVEPEAVTEAEGVGFMNSDDDGWNDTHNQVQMPEPTGKAKQWDGWKTALKPATEFVVVARKPFTGTVAECVQMHGTGALNIDGCRIGTAEIKVNDTSYRTAKSGEFSNQGITPDERGVRVDTGRYPANVIFDEDAATALDRDVGELDAGAHTTVAENESVNTYGNQVRDVPEERTPTDSGGPSRYFYTSKATRAERTLNGKIQNSHPTVKPIDLMTYLVRLVTAENQIVLDPFTGTGTTLKAAKNLNRRFIGIEKQPKWADVARVRAGLTPVDPGHIRGDDAQQGLEGYTD